MPAAEFGRRGWRSVPINVAGVRRVSGSKGIERQFSHNSSPATFSMKSTMPMALARGIVDTVNRKPI